VHDYERGLLTAQRSNKNIPEAAGVFLFDPGFMRILCYTLCIPMKNQIKAGAMSSFARLAVLVSFLTVQGFNSTTVLAAGPSDPVSVTTYGFTIGASSSFAMSNGIPTGDGTFTTGDLDDLTKYPETTCVPMVIAVKNTGNSKQDLKVSPWFEFVGGGKQGNVDLEIITTTLGGGVVTGAGNLNQFAYPGTSLKNAVSFPTKEGGTVAATVSGPFSGRSTGTGAPLATEGYHHYNVVLKQVPKNGTVNMLVCARLAVDANLFAGGNITTGVAKASSNDADHVDIITSQVLSLPTLTLEKDLIGGSATSSDFVFTVVPPINGQSVFNIPNGMASVTIPNVLPASSYTVTESGPSGYVFSSGAGTNCSFNASTASAQPAPGVLPANAVCIFSNKAEVADAKLTVTKVVVNDNGGTMTVTDFPLFVNGQSVVSGEQNTYEPGTYQVTETANAAYPATYSGDCDENGNVTLAAGEVKNCMITNDDRSAKLIVTKVVVNDQGGANVVQDFPLFVGAQPVVSGSENNFLPGTYTITELEDGGYIGSFSGACDANGNVTLAIGETKECIVTNNDLPVGLTIVTRVINDNGGTLTPSDFTTFVQGVGVPFSIFTGSSEGISIDLGAGPYNVGQVLNDGYDATFSAGCFGFINEGEKLVCMITNTDL
jgi:hypothetical protein